MNSKKLPSWENNSEKIRETRQSKNNKSTRASDKATVDDEKFLKAISKELEKIENEREAQIKILKKRVEDFKKVRLRYSHDTNSQQLATKAEQLLEQLHKKLYRPPSYQDVAQMDSDSNVYERHGDGTKTTSGFGNDRMTPRRTRTNSGHSSLEGFVQSSTYPPTHHSAMEVESDSRADQCYDNSTNAPVGSFNERTVPGHTPTTSTNRIMKVSEQPPIQPPTYDDDDVMISMAGLADTFDNKAKRTTGSMSTQKSEQAPTKNGRQFMEFTDQNTLEADGSRKLCLLLLGSAGNGKSSIGNSILGKYEFKTSSSVNSSTLRIAMGSAQVGDQTVQVVDGPSILDSRGNEQDFMEQVLIAMEKSLTLCDYAFSAIVIVLRFGVRFTKQEVDTIKLIKSVLGKDVIKDYGICAIAGGDNFDLSVEEAMEDGQELTFEGWCREQTGEVKALFEECSFRCVLFDNRTKDENKKSAQRLALLKVVNPEMTYSKEKFLKAERSLRGLLATEALIPDLEQQTQKLIDETRSNMQQITDDDSVQYNTRMNSLLQRLIDHEVTIHDIGLKSQNLTQLVISLKVLKCEIISKISHRKQIESNRRSFTPTSRNPLSQTPPLDTKNVYEHSFDSYEWVNSGGIEPRTCNDATMSSNAWHTEQRDFNPVPNAQGHMESKSVREKGTWDWIKQNGKRIWDLIKKQL